MAFWSTEAGGYTGSAGFVGSTGFTGSRGFDGSRGFTGSQGFTGSIGFTGSAGFVGSTGFTGSRGFDGSRGFTGSQGFTGSRGFDGSRGFTGSQGFTGSIGFTGSAGVGESLPVADGGAHMLVSNYVDPPEPVWQFAEPFVNGVSKLDMPGYSTLTGTYQPVTNKIGANISTTGAGGLSGTGSRFYARYLNNGPTILTWLAISETASFDPNNIAAFGQISAFGLDVDSNDILFFVAYGDDAVPTAPEGDFSGTAITVGTNTINSVNFRYGYMVAPLLNTIIDNLSTAAAYKFYYIRGVDADDPVHAHISWGFASGQPVCPSVTVTTPGCLILGIGIEDDAEYSTFGWAYEETNGYNFLGESAYGTAEAGGFIVSQYKASFETGVETPPTFGITTVDDANVGITVALKPKFRSISVPVPSGGTTGQVLSKVNATDYNLQWSTPASGGGASTVQITSYTSGSGTFTANTSAKYFEVYCTGGGGGGGGSDSDGGSGSASGGGGAGGTAIKFYTAAQMGATAAYSVGTGGSAGSTTGGNGGNGGASTFNPIGTGDTLTGNGGTGGTGTGNAFSAANGAFLGGGGGTGTNGDLNVEGGSGGAGWSDSTIALAGDGGNSFFGGGTRGPVRNTAGTAAATNGDNFGGGGSGSIDTNNTTGLVGGTGFAGVIVVVQYI